ncbi:MAG: DNA primase [Flavobacteriaceae bacterium]|nr:DNA primase [Flavobacteriaceae bacterium]MDC3220997.1 DNA primase [Flavobacteriaceae bacterium]MDG1343441.1 DNA primase [Flavobacteriaceae bacterium]MDG2485014.1 DNA primase [Flavobacteriaceae bacterium]
MISKTTIDKVFEQSLVEEVVGEFVQLKKSGSNYKGLSPFSNEKTPSFVVSPVKQIWKDFSSGKGGNAVAFLMEHEHFTYPEAIKYLARKYNIEIEETQVSSLDKEKASEKESLFIVSEYAKDFFSDTLINSSEGKSIGFSYFKERGFSDETIKKYDLGYLPDKLNYFSKEAIANGYDPVFLEKSGLSIFQNEKSIDRFRGRVIFPIHSMSGRILGFGGRILNNQLKTAKYLNSPESLIYNKSKILYGIFFAKQDIAKLDNCFIVEGYTDVIQLHQKGIKNVVSSSGTALTIDQITLIRRLTSNVTMLFDGDKAGVNATLRGIDIILTAGLNVNVCSFPNGEDPDSYSQDKSFDEIDDYLKNNSKDFIQFKASILAQNSKNDPISKANTINEIINSISIIPDRIKQEIYVKHCSSIMDISEEVLFNSLAQKTKNEIHSISKKRIAKVQKTTRNKDVNLLFELEKKIIEILLLYGSKQENFEELILKNDEDGNVILEPTTVNSLVYEKIFLDLQQDEIEFTNESFKIIYEKIINEFQKNQKLILEVFLNSLNQDLANHVTGILMNEDQYELHDWLSKDIFVKHKDKVISQLVSETILSLRTFLINKKVEELKEETKGSLENDKILEEIGEYHKLKTLLSKKLNRVL